jgi:hypothetical protein
MTTTASRPSYSDVLKTSRSPSVHTIHDTTINLEVYENGDIIMQKKFLASIPAISGGSCVVNGISITRLDELNQFELRWPGDHTRIVGVGQWDLTKKDIYAVEVQEDDSAMPYSFAFTTNLGHMLMDEKLAELFNFIIEVKDGVEIPFHRDVLLQSTFFINMIHGYRKAYGDDMASCTIEHATVETMLMIRSYFYGLPVTLKPDTVENIMSVAQQLELHPLVQVCEDYKMEYCL